MQNILFKFPTVHKTVLLDQEIFCYKIQEKVK